MKFVEFKYLKKTNYMISLVVYGSISTVTYLGAEILN